MEHQRRAFSTDMVAFSLFRFVSFFPPSFSCVAKRPPSPSATERPARGLPLPSSALFHIEPDWPTPRPHLIVLGNEASRFRSVYDVCAVVGADDELLALVQRVVDEHLLTSPAYDGSSPLILSHHLGFFSSRGTSPNFHAHICTPIGLYDSLLRRSGQYDTQSPPIRPTRGWLAPGAPDEIWLDRYLHSAARYIRTLAFEQGAKYKAGDLKTIADWSSGRCSAPSDLAVPAGFALAWNEPRLLLLHAAARSRVASHRQLLNAAQALGLADHKTGGCHACLFVSTTPDLSHSVFADGEPAAAAAADAHSASTRVEPCDGYLQLTADAYYRLCRPELRQRWITSVYEPLSLVVLT